MIKGFKVIDIEHHFDLELMIDKWRKSMTHEEWIATGGDTIDNPTPSSKMMYDLVKDLSEKRLKAMDNAGIDCAHISLTTPGAEYFKPAIGKKIAKASNDALMAAIKKYPNRFGAWMALVPDDVEWSLKEIDRCVKGGMFGWSTLSNFNGKYLDDPKYLPILKKLAKLKMPIYLHPNFLTFKAASEFGYCLSGPSYGFTADTQLAYMRLIHRGVFDKCPGLKIFMGHDGEGFPFFKNRMDTAWRQGFGQPASNIGVKIKHEPSYYFDKNTFFTTSGNYSQEALICSVKVAGIGKCFLGTDFPYENVKEMVEFIGNNKALTKEQKAAILYKNAEAIGFGKKH